MANNKYGFGSKKADELQRRLDEKNKNGTVGGSTGISNGGISSSGSASSAKQPTSPSVERKQEADSMTPSVKQTANERLSVLRKGYFSPEDDALDVLFDRVVNQKPFDYDVIGDPTYNQYAETFRRNAALMSEDAMAQAAALTGGYGSSYGQAVGTQAYNEQMSRLNDIVPELRESAYGKYKDERARALEDLTLAINERDYERSIFESDRAFEEDQRRFDIGTDLDKARLDFQKYQYDNEIEREDAQRAEDRNAAALELGFKSWDEYVKAVESGKYILGSNDNLTLSEIQKASDIFKNDGYSGLEKYISQLEQTGKSYSDEQFYSLIFGATGLENVDTYDDAISWISTKSSSNMNENRTRSPLDEDDEDSVAFGGYPGAAFSGGSGLSESTKSNIATAKNIVKTESEWKKNPSYGSYPEYLRYTLLDIISE